MKKLLLAAILLTICFSACRKHDDDPKPFYPYKDITWVCTKDSTLTLNINDTAININWPVLDPNPSYIKYTSNEDTLYCTGYRNITIIISKDSLNWNNELEFYKK